jgi:CheY-like chemotaxis protein
VSSGYDGNICVATAMLEDLGEDVTTAASGADALEIIARQPALNLRTRLTRAIRRR